VHVEGVKSEVMEVLDRECFARSLLRQAAGPFPNAVSPNYTTMTTTTVLTARGLLSHISCWGVQLSSWMPSLVYPIYADSLARCMPAATQHKADFSLEIRSKRLQCEPASSEEDQYDLNNKRSFKECCTNQVVAYGVSRQRAAGEARTTWRAFSLGLRTRLHVIRSCFDRRLYKKLKL